jgi:hypothetical protein
MASNKGIWFMLGGGLVVGLGIAVFVIVFVGKRAENKEMRSQVKQWGTEYDAARACLTGDSPLTSDASDAVALRDATSDGAITTCLTHFQKNLDRPGDSSVRNSKVEAAWLALDKSIGSLAQAYARRIDGYNLDEIPRYRKELGDALAKVDAKYNELRAASGLGAWTPPGDAELTSMGARAPVAIEGKTLPPDTTEMSRDALVVNALLGDTHATTQAVIRGPDAIETVLVDAAVLRAADPAAWGVRNIRNEAGHYELRAGPLKADGSADGDGVAVAATASPDEDMGTMFATGSGSTRVIVYWLQLPAADATLWLARSSDSGATWPDNTMLGVPSDARVALDVAHRRLDLTYTVYEPPAGSYWLSIRGAEPTASTTPIRVFGIDDRFEGQCMAGGSSWWLTRSELHKIDTTGTRKRVVTLGADELVACDADQALLALEGDLGTKQYILCGATTCKAHMKVPAGDRAPIAVLGEKLGVVVATQVGELMVVWRVAGGQRVFDVFRAKDDAEPLALQESNGALHALYIGETSIDYAALPLAR